MMSKDEDESYITSDEIDFKLKAVTRKEKINSRESSVL